MAKYIVAGLVGVAALVFAISLSYVVYWPQAPRVYNESLQKVEKRGYSVGDAAGGDAAGAEAEAFDLPTALAAATPEDGAKIAKKCLACHSMEKGGPDKVGPNLYGIIGASKAHSGSFAYSDAMKAKGGTWNYDDMFAFLTKPSAFVPGTKMSFAGLKKPNDTAKLIVYLRSLHDNPPALPPVTAKPAEAPAAEPAPAH